MKILSALLIGTIAFFFATHSESRELKYAPPPQVIFVDGYLLSSISKIVRDIADARGDIHENKPENAKKVLNDAHLRLEFARQSSPMSAVRDYIWVARKHLSYEDTDKVIRDLITVEEGLDNIGKSRFVENAKAYIDKTIKSLENKNKEAAGLELELADKALEYSGLDLPLSTADGYILSALQYLEQNDAGKADRELRSAEDEFQFVVSELYAPLPKAGKSLPASARSYASKEYAASKRHLEEARNYLERVIASGNDETKSEAKKLLGDLDVIKIKVEKGEKAASQSIESLWERTEALAERDAEYTALVVRRVEKVNEVKKDIIDAKMHILYAEAYHLTEGKPGRAQTELRKAETYINNAISRADEATKNRLTAIDKKIKGLRSEVKVRNRSLRSRYRDIEEELYSLIQK